MSMVAQWRGSSIDEEPSILHGQSPKRHDQIIFGLRGCSTRKLAFLKNVVIDRKKCQLETAIYSQLVEDVREVMLYGLFAKPKLIRDLRVRIAFQHGHHNLVIPGLQLALALLFFFAPLLIG